MPSCHHGVIHLNIVLQTLDRFFNLLTGLKRVLVYQGTLEG